ncbi:MAG: T9SS type A sorting domain-containing protein, partial [Flavobacteriales bacterium]|nr:T9SS type A sorting domain-containing protein [Flavobacteriales bacterium]
GCAVALSVTVTEPAAISTSTSSTNSSCTVDDGTATVVATGGNGPYSYVWTPSSQTSATAIGIGAGTYTVVVTDADGCSVSATATVGNANAPSLTNSASDETCSGTGDGTATVSATGGTQPYVYLWDDPGAQAAATAVGLSAGTYTVTVTDATGCIAIGSSTVSSSGGPTVTTNSSAASCGASDGVASANATGGTAPYTYLWSDPGAQTGPTAVNLTAGTYTVLVTDAGGCSVSSTVTVTSAGGGATVTTIAVGENCGNGDGSAAALASGGTPPYNYLWNDPTAQTNSTATGLSAGTYTVIVGDASGCSTSSTVVVNGSVGPTATTSVTGSTCGNSDGSATVVATGGTPPYSYSWNDPGTQTSATASGLGSGSYTIVVTDATGCTGTQIASVSDIGAPTITTSSTDIDCNGDGDGSATVNATGGATPYTYLWNDPNSQATSTAGSLSGGVFSVTVTDAVGCKAVTTVTVIEPAALLANATTTTTISGQCTGTASANVSGGVSPFTYVWSDGAAQTSGTATGLCQGTYTVLIVDGNGCSAIGNVSVSNWTNINEVENDLTYLIYPNPSSGNVNVELSLKTQGYVEIRVYNGIGSLISVDKFDNVSDYKHIINCSSYGTGLYYVHLITEEEMFVNKITIVQ